MNYTIEHITLFDYTCVVRLSVIVYTCAMCVANARIETTVSGISLTTVPPKPSVQSSTHILYNHPPMFCTTVYLHFCTIVYQLYLRNPRDLHFCYPSTCTSVNPLAVLRNYYPQFCTIFICSSILYLHNRLPALLHNVLLALLLFLYTQFCTIIYPHFCTII